MNQIKHSISGVIVHPVPLFASSWVALYCYIRNILDKDRTQGDSPAEAPQTEVEHTTH